MPRDGAGNFTLPFPTANPNTIISSTENNANNADLQTALTGSIASNGETVPTANLPMGNFRHTGVSNATARNQYAAAGQVQDGALVFGGVTAGTSSAYTATVTPGVTALVDGMAIRVRAHVTCADNPTLNLNGLGAKKIYLGGTVQAQAGDIVLNSSYEYIYNTVLDGGAGGWVQVNGSSAALSNWTTLSITTLSAATTSGTLAMGTAFTRFRLSLQDMTASAAGANLVAQFSNDGGTTWLTASSYYQQIFYANNASSFAVLGNPTSSISLTTGMPAASISPYNAEFVIAPGTASLRASMFGTVAGLDFNGFTSVGTFHGAWNGTPARMTAIRVIPTSGNFSGTIVVEGRR